MSLSLMLAMVCAVEAQPGARGPDARAAAIEPGAISLQVGVHLPVQDTAVLAEPRLGLQAMAGYFPRRGLEVGLGAVVGLPDAPTREVLARAVYHLRLPIIRGFAGGAIGYQRLAFAGGDVASDQDRLRFGLHVGFHLDIPRAPGTRVFVTPVVQMTYSTTYELGHDPVFGQSPWSRQLALVGAVAIAF